MTEPLFDPKRAAIIIRASKLQELHDLQQRILIVERFGVDAVPYPGIQSKLGSIHSLEELLAKHGEIVHEVKRLTEAIDAASDIEIAEIVAAVKRHR